jgi:predicted dienelactone hydrolase
MHDAMYADIALQDVRRGVDVPVRVRWPRVVGEMAGPAPLVIFSHGAGGSGEAFGDLTEHWATHGYVVALPTHADSVRNRRRRGEDVSALRDDPHAVLRGVDMMDRRADVALVLDSITEMERTTGLAIDRGRIAMAGHSAGAFTTQMLAGVKVGIPAEVDAGGALRERLRARERAALRSLGDARVRAAIVISGQGLTSPVLNERSWEDVSIPMLVIAGSADVSPLEDSVTPASRRDPYEMAPPGGKHLLFIEGATHSSYAGRRTSRLTGETPPTNVDAITSLVSFSTTAFLDAHLRADTEAQEYLRSGEIASYPGVIVEWRTK